MYRYEVRNFTRINIAPEKTKYRNILYRGGCNTRSSITSCWVKHKLSLSQGQTVSDENKRTGLFRYYFHHISSAAEAVVVALHLRLSMNYCGGLTCQSVSRRRRHTENNRIIYLFFLSFYRRLIIRAVVVRAGRHGVGGGVSRLVHALYTRDDLFIFFFSLFPFFKKERNAQNCVLLLLLLLRVRGWKPQPPPNVVAATATGS